MFYITTTKTFCKSNKIDDAKRNAGLTTPEDIERFDNLRYGDHRTRNILDVYRPKNRQGKLPVIVSLEVCSGAHKFCPERWREAMGFPEEKTE